MIEDSFEYKKGINIIIPTYKGEKYILKLLESLKNQTLDYNLFEAIIIINGERDSTEEIIKDFTSNNPNLNILLEFSPEGVSNARNHGISIANREYITFIDDDDYISPKFLEKMYEHSAPGRIVIGTFLDEDDKTGKIKKSYLSPPLFESKGIIKNPYNYMKDILVITTDKLIPTKAVKAVDFNPILKNGVDISYFAKLYSKFDFEFFIIDKEEKAVYFRLWRDNSISRQSTSYEFNITGRLNVIDDINKQFNNTHNPKKVQFLKELTVGQVSKMNLYLKENPNDLEKVSYDINKYKFKFFPYKYFNTDFNNLNKENNELIISYAFSPTNTTTSNVMAKRILKSEKNVDIIQASLDNLSKDYEFESLLNEFILNKTIIEMDFSIEWKNIKEFIIKGIDKLKNKNYKKIYSRCYYQHSHFLALEYKLLNKDVFWSAEFSDPTIYNFKGDEKTPPINDENYINKINSYLPDNLPKIQNNDSLNFICEYVSYVFADEIVFTNENQKEVMLDLFPHQEIREIVDKKYKINPHPTLDKKYYYLKEMGYEIDSSHVNFAYFGDIFGNRTLEDFINAFDTLDTALKDKFKLHIFTSNITFFEQILSSNVMKNTYLNPQIPFLEFLNLSTKFDCLIVNDTYTKNLFKVNPFLPSKIMDYIGSGRDIWAICDKNSPMDKMDIKYKSLIHDIDFNQYTLSKILLDKTNIKESDLKNSKNNLNDDIEYLQNRISELTVKIEELISVAEGEFNKNNLNLELIRSLKEENEKLKHENNEIINSNSWKIINKFKNKFR
ncbi:glycosyltransferase [Methanobrevibacter sp. DSM 116169]|uniref:glycosyltransferase n=1 Tax=Methanobrevibacter sp. DSM 116169 TaxID=3242727 RepID=UPI0038FC6BCD